MLFLGLVTFFTVFYKGIILEFQETGVRYLKNISLELCLSTKKPLPLRHRYMFFPILFKNNYGKLQGFRSREYTRDVC